MHDRFYDTPAADLDLAPFDIETTGFKTNNMITTVVMYHQDLYHIWLNTDGDDSVDAAALRATIEEASGFDNCVLHLCNDEAGLLRNLDAYINDAFTETTLLLAFNGDTWKGGFDIPFIRTRCAVLGAPYPFDGVWFTDPYEVFTEHGVFNTTVSAEPQLGDMKRTDLEQFVDDNDLDVNYDSMRKTQIVRALDDHEDATPEGVAMWAGKDTDRQDFDDYNASTLKDYIDSKSLDIPYDRLDKDALISAIRQSAYTEQMLIEWHEETGRDIGNKDLRKLDATHAELFEPRFTDEDWVASTPYPVEVFDPFDPYEDSGEAVTAYLNQNYDGVILHCLADVAKTVNMSRMMVEYAPKNQYKPTIL